MNVRNMLVALCLGLCLALAGAEKNAPRSPNAPEAEEGEIPPDAPQLQGPAAEVVALPPEPSAKKPAVAPKAEIKKAPAKAAQPVAASSARPNAIKSTVVPTQLPPLQSPVERAKEAGYGVVLSGVIEKNMELGPEQSPVMIRGVLVIPERITLSLKPGTVVHFVADPTAKKPAAAGEPDPTQSAALWVWGSLNASGHTGDPVELSSFDATPAPLLFYGSASSSLEGVRLRNCAVVQNAGTVRWTNSEFLSTPHLALAGGAAIVTHCSFRNCGGIFATYQSGTWSLLVRRSVFASCKEGIVLASDPGETRLVVEKNHFLNTRGAHIRAMNLAGAAPSDGDIFIGENWYGTPQADEVDLRIADRRLDPRVKARLNIRPPSAQPYENIGGGVSANTLSDSMKEQESIAQKLLSAHAGKTPARSTAAPEAPARTSSGAKTSDGPKASEGAKTSDGGKSGAAMSRTIRRPREMTGTAK